MSKMEIGRVEYSFLCLRLDTAKPLGCANSCGCANPLGGELDPEPFIKIANMKTRQKDILDMGSSFNIFVEIAHKLNYFKDFGILYELDGVGSSTNGFTTSVSSAIDMRLRLGLGVGSPLACSIPSRTLLLNM